VIAMVDTARLDPARIASIQLARAVTDPIIIDKRARDQPLSEQVQSDIRVARLTQVQDAGPREPVTRASWPETAAYFSTLSLSVPLTADGTDMYQWAFRRYLVDVRGLEGEDLPAPASDAEPPAEHLRRNLETLRKHLKRRRDDWYLEEHYEGEAGVPKAF